MSENLHRLRIRAGSSNALVSKETALAVSQPEYNETRRYLSIRSKEDSAEYSKIKPITVRDMIGYYAENDELQADVEDIDRYFVGGVVLTDNSKVLLISNEDSIPIRLENSAGSFVLSTEGNIVASASKILYVDNISKVSTAANSLLTMMSPTVFNSTLRVLGSANFVDKVVLEANADIGTTIANILTVNSTSNFKSPVTIAGTTTINNTLTVNELSTFNKGILVSNGITTDELNSTGNISIKDDDNNNVVSFDTDGNGVFASKLSTNTFEVESSSVFGGEIDASGQTLKVNKIVVGA